MSTSAHEQVLLLSVHWSGQCASAFATICLYDAMAGLPVRHARAVCNGSALIRANLAEHQVHAAEILHHDHCGGTVTTALCSIASLHIQAAHATG